MVGLLVEFNCVYGH